MREKGGAVEEDERARFICQPNVLHRNGRAGFPPLMKLSYSFFLVVQKEEGALSSQADATQYASRTNGKEKSKRNTKVRCNDVR